MMEMLAVLAVMVMLASFFLPALLVIMILNFFDRRIYERNKRRNQERARDS